MREIPSEFLQELLDGNEQFAASFATAGRAGLQVQPRRRTAVLTCMDSRYTAQGVTGLEPGDAHVIRNAGGRATDDALRSLILSASLLGTRRCVVIHHTDCGIFDTGNEYLRDRVAEVTGVAPEIDFLPFSDLEASVREDVEILRASPYFPPDYEVLGFVYDVRTGRLTPVDEA